MKSFSQRKGLKPVKVEIQTDSMDTDLRNRLWNALTLHYWRKIGEDIGLREKYGPIVLVPKAIRIIQALWNEYFKLPLDTISWRWLDIQGKIREHYFSSGWNEVYDLIEFIAKFDDYGESARFMELCNAVLQEEVSAYRFVGGLITQVTSGEEISEIEEVLKTRIDPVTTHLETALKLLSNRKSPDYPNSIKESISAVEAICRLITKDPNATLGQSLRVVKQKIPLHPALEGAFTKLYGYTSTAEGIRHALLEERRLDFEDAKFMLVSCSAFINYLMVKSSKAGIAPTGADTKTGKQQREKKEGV